MMNRFSMDITRGAAAVAGAKSEWSIRTTKMRRIRQNSSRLMLDSRRYLHIFSSLPIRAVSPKNVMKNDDFYRAMKWMITRSGISQLVLTISDDGYQGHP